MRNSKEIYENILLNDCFNRLKILRNSWTYEKNDKFGLATIIDIFGDDYLSYDSIMRKTEKLIFDMIPNLCKLLLNEYGIQTEWYRMLEKEARVFSINGEENWTEYVEHPQKNIVYAFKYENSNNEKILYIFKKFGLDNRVPNSLIRALLKNEEIDKYYYISLVDSEAYSEIINHDTESDEITKGTGRYSLKQFFELFFDESEYNLFKMYSNILARNIKDYYGFQIVRTLTPNSLYNYKKVIRESIINYDFSKGDSINQLTSTQRDLINDYFFSQNNYEILLGSSVFAQSFMTSEWLFFSLRDAGNIDLTSIAMGYFKAVEQFLFSFISLHTIEKDCVCRKIYAGTRPLEILSDSLLNDNKKVNNINLKSLTRFFGENRKQKYNSRNTDLLVEGISDETYYFIIETLSTFVGLRNGYFHKHNLNDWEVVVKAREHALLIFYLILGGYRVSEKDKKALGMIETVNNGYYELCEYIHNRMYDFNMFEIPIFYFKEDCNIYDFYFSHQDSFVKYGSQGEPIYSGVYFRVSNDSGNVVKFTNDSIPTEIWEGKLIIGQKKFDLNPSGPLTKIFFDGKFIKGE